jgi:hypothetical protein
MANNRYISVAVRRLTPERAQHCCEYCIASAHFNTDSFQFEKFIGINWVASAAFHAFVIQLNLFSKEVLSFLIKIRI